MVSYKLNTLGRSTDGHLALSACVKALVGLSYVDSSSLKEGLGSDEVKEIVKKTFIPIYGENVSICSNNEFSRDAITFTTPHDDIGPVGTSVMSRLIC